MLNKIKYMQHVSYQPAFNGIVAQIVPFELAKFLTKSLKV